MGVLEDGFDDAGVLSEALFGECDVDVQVGEGAVELVVVGGGELQGQALGDQVGQQRVLPLVPQEVRVVLKRLRLVLSLRRRQVPDQRQDVLVLDRHEAEELPQVARVVGRRGTQVRHRHILIIDLGE